MTTRGAVYVAYGAPAMREARASVATLRHHHPDLLITVLVAPDSPALPLLDDLTVVRRGPAADPGARLAKFDTAFRVDYDQVLYLDADTRVRGPLNAGFALLDDGWDIALVPSTRQDHDVLGNLSAADRSYTLERAGTWFILALQCGLLFYRRTDPVLVLFQRWCDEWLRYRDRDQGAFIRALYQYPVRLWLLGRPFNGGTLVEHLFGAATRKRG